MHHDFNAMTFLAVKYHHISTLSIPYTVFLHRHSVIFILFILIRFSIFYSIFLRCYFFFLFASTQLNSSQLQSFSTNKKVHKNICEGFVHNRIKITKFSSKRKTENKTGAKTTVFFCWGQRRQLNKSNEEKKEKNQQALS